MTAGTPFWATPVERREISGLWRFPQEGDGEVILRDLMTGKNTHLPAGARPQPVASAAAEEGRRPKRAAPPSHFRRTASLVVFSTFAAKAIRTRRQGKEDGRPNAERRHGDRQPGDGAGGHH